MKEPTKIAWKEMYDDGPGVEHAVRYDGRGDEGRGTIEFEAVDSVQFPLKRIDWLINCPEKIRDETGM